MGGGQDTLAFETSQKIVKQTSGLLEKEIDPAKYILGPNDYLAISIVSVRTRQYEIPISADGKLLIPEVGAVSLKGKTLAEAEVIIHEKINQVLKTSSIGVALTRLREFKVTVSGAVVRPSIVSATAVDRVSEAIEKAGGFSGGAIRSIKIKREGVAEPINVDLALFFSLGIQSANPTVLGGDYIIVSRFDYSNILTIEGEVQYPGIYEYRDNDSLSTLLRLAGGFKKTAFLDSVEIVRSSQSGNMIEKWTINLRSWENITKEQSHLPGDFQLQRNDRVYVRKIPDYKPEYYISIDGAIKFPGQYAILENQIKLSDAIKLAGGLTEDAYEEGAIVVRRKEWLREDRELIRLSKLSINEMSVDDKNVYSARVNELRGSISFKLKNALSDYNSKDNISLVHFDSIYIPKQEHFINVQGRVNNPGLVHYKPGSTYLDYVEAAGGFGYEADKNQTMIIKRKGERFNAKEGKYAIQPGDTIIVPQEEPSSFWMIFTTSLTVLTQIMAIVGLIITLSR
jgi:protein involved in polysaccharide export with SLBB domain